LVAATAERDLIGSDFLSLISTPARSAVRYRLQQRYLRSLDNEVVPLLRRDGSEAMVTISSRIVRRRGGPAVEATFAEIPDWVNRFRQMIRGVTTEVSEAVIIIDPQLHIVSWNQSAQRLYGWSDTEVLGQPVMDILRWAHSDTSIWGTTSEGTRRWTGEGFQFARDGRLIGVRSVATVINDENGSAAGFVVVNKDITAELTGKATP
jgi:PAS domain S-box-containing protein